MEDVFITGIKINKVRNLEDMEILLSKEERKHLIITGKNGSGKTSLLEAIRENFSSMRDYSIGISGLYSKHQRMQHIRESVELDASNSAGEVLKTNTVYELMDLMLVYIHATRILDMDVPMAIEIIPNFDKISILTEARRSFLKYMLYMNYQRLTYEKGEVAEKHRINEWFDRFESALREIYNCADLVLKNYPKELIFKIEMPGYEPFSLNEMADGYYALLNIVMELIMRMDEEEGDISYDKPAIVFIDEIETHLHVTLQKKVLPFLTRMFPNTQFIVTTHSPFVVTSLDNAVVYDLEHKDVLENPMIYSYEAVVEAFFDTDMYSEKMKGIFKRYKELSLIMERTLEEEKELIKLRIELEQVPPASKELYFAFKEAEKEQEVRNNG